MSHLSNVASSGLPAGHALDLPKPRPSLAAPPSPVLRATGRGDRPSHHPGRPSGVCRHVVQRSGRAGAHDGKALPRRWHPFCGGCESAGLRRVPSRFEGGGLAPAPSSRSPDSAPPVPNGELKRGGDPIVSRRERGNSPVTADPPASAEALPSPATRSTSQDAGLARPMGRAGPTQKGPAGKAVRPGEATGRIAG